MASSSSSAAPVVATSSKAPARGPSGPPRSACFPDVPRGASATRVAAPPTEFWAVHGMYYRIPPLYDQLKTVRASETPPGWATYAQWQASFRGGPGPPPRAPGSERMPASRGSLAALRQPGGSGPSGLNSMVPLLPGEDALDDAGVPPTDPRREEYERWRGCWKTIVRRDIARQQRTLITQQKETLAGCRRAALAVQKEVRRKALRAQRLAMSSQIQIKCKKLVRDMGNTYKEGEAAREAARKEAARQAWLAAQPAPRAKGKGGPGGGAPPAKRMTRPAPAHLLSSPAAAAAAVAAAAPSEPTPAPRAELPEAPPAEEPLAPTPAAPAAPMDVEAEEGGEAEGSAGYEGEMVRLRLSGVTH